jgi:hypothetical protein
VSSDAAAEKACWWVKVVPEAIKQSNNQQNKHKCFGFVSATNGSKNIRKLQPNKLAVLSGTATNCIGWKEENMCRVDGLYLQFNKIEKKNL